MSKNATTEPHREDTTRDPLWGVLLAFWFAAESERKWVDLLFSVILASLGLFAVHLLIHSLEPGVLFGILFWLISVVFFSKACDMVSGCGGIFLAAILGLLTAVFICVLR